MRRRGAVPDSVREEVRATRQVRLPIPTGATADDQLWTFACEDRNVPYVTEHAEPSFGAEAAPRRAPLLARFRGIGERERWGYGVWLLMGLVIAVPEIWAGVGTPPWPTISATVGHLEARWNWVAIIVVALIVIVAARAASYLQPQTDQGVTPGGGQGQWRTQTGRLAMSPDEVSQASEMWAIVYFAIAILAVVVAGLLTASRTSDKWVLAYVIYGLIALFFVVIPNAAVLLLKRDLPYSTLLCTVDDLRRRWHPAAMVILAGLVVLLIHLAFYPWPHVVQPPTTNSA
jgi:hypothetical protein